MFSTAPEGFEGELTTIIRVRGPTADRRVSSTWNVAGERVWCRALAPAIRAQGS